MHGNSLLMLNSVFLKYEGQEVHSLGSAINANPFLLGINLHQPFSSQ